MYAQTFLQMKGREVRGEQRLKKLDQNAKVCIKFAIYLIDLLGILAGTGEETPKPVPMEFRYPRFALHVFVSSRSSFARPAKQNILLFC
jgi:hypothetical protein